MWAYLQELWQRIIGKEEPAPVLFNRISDPMVEASFWQIINKSLEKAQNVFDQIDFLEIEFAKLSPQVLIGFHLRMQQLLTKAHTNSLWCACAILAKMGDDDDAFTDFKYWVIARGEKNFYAAIENPDSLINHFDDDEFYDMNELAYLPNESFKKQTNQDMFEYIDLELFHRKNGVMPSFAPSWYKNHEEIEENMRTLCPLLMEKCWEE